MTDKPQITGKSIFEAMAEASLRKAGVDPTAEAVAEYLAEMSKRSMAARRAQKRRLPE